MLEFSVRRDPPVMLNCGIMPVTMNACCLITSGIINNGGDFVLVKLMITDSMDLARISNIHFP
jgi:hypothetical protein